jgi:hypothetical protein
VSLGLNQPRIVNFTASKNAMSDDKKVIFSMVKVSKTFPPQKQVLKDIYLSFFYGAKNNCRCREVFSR